MQVLLVDDSRTVIAVFGARLVALGYEVVAAENGQVAVERFQASAPDLVLMDIEMPVMGGFEAAQRIRAVEATQEWAWTPIIFLTASDTPENLVMAIEAGGDDFLAKSAPEAVLQAKMKAMTRIAALRAELSLANRKLEALASRDGLTGLFNRRHMDVRLDHQWAEAVRSGASFGLLISTSITSRNTTTATAISRATIVCARSPVFLPRRSTRRTPAGLPATPLWHATVARSFPSCCRAARGRPRRRWRVLFWRRCRGWAFPTRTAPAWAW